MIARVLHLIDPRQSSWPALTLLKNLVGGNTGSVAHEVMLIGGTSAARQAADAGIASADRIAPIVGRPALAARALRRYLAARRAPDAIVAWSVPTAMLAQQASRATPVVAVLTLPPPPFEGAAQWTFAARAIRKSALIVYPSAFLRDSWVARFTLLGCPGTVIRPTIAAPEQRDSQRLALRQEWGAGKDTIVITPLGEPAEAIDAHAAVFAAGVLGVAGFPATVVVPPDASRLDRALRFASRIRPSRRVIVDDRPPPSILPGCDLALWFEPEGESTRPGRSVYTTPLGAVSLAWAEAFGVPIVAHDHPAWRSVLGESARCIPVEGRTRHPLTRAILQAIKASPRDARAALSAPNDWGRAFEARVLSLLRERSRSLVEVR